MNKSIRFKPTSGLVRALSKNLYRDPNLMAGEIAYNGLDAAERCGREPVIEVRFWSVGEHPLSLDAPALSFLDNGPGFTPEVIADYVLVGESVYLHNPRFHGAHGLGKFAAFGFSTAGSFLIITRPLGETRVVCYRVSVDDIFSDNEIKAEPVRTPLPGLPTKGSFACIFIPGFNDLITAEELRESFANLLPIRPCQVSVQGVPVVLRRLEAEREVTTLPLPAFGGSTLTIRLAVAEVTGQNDRVRIIDAESSRPVASLDTLPPSVRRRLDHRLLHPRLLGEILVPGNLEKRSETGRAGIAADYWRSDQGGAFIDAMNIYGAPLAGELVGSDAKPRGPINESLSEVANLFKERFGEPDDSIEPEPEGNGPNPSKKPGVKPPRSDSHGGGERKTGEGDDQRKKRSRSDPPPFGGVLVRVEGATYTVISFACASNVPAHVRSGNVIVINTKHQQIERLQKLPSARVREELARDIIEAHVASECDDNSDLFGRVYQILGQMHF